MGSGLIGKKIGMTSIFTDDGNNIPCTVIEAQPNVVTQVKTTDGSDGYSAVQLGYGEKKEKRTSKAMQGHFDKAGTTGKKKLVEFRIFQAKKLDSVTRCGWKMYLQKEMLWMLLVHRRVRDFRVL